MERMGRMWEEPFSSRYFLSCKFITGELCTWSGERRMFISRLIMRLWHRVFCSFFFLFLFSSRQTLKSCCSCSPWVASLGQLVSMYRLLWSRYQVERTSLQSSSHQRKWAMWGKRLWICGLHDGWVSRWNFKFIYYFYIYMEQCCYRGFFLT